MPERKRKMKRVLTILAGAIPLLVGMKVVAQQTPAPAQGDVIIKQRVQVQDGLPTPPPGDKDFVFIMSEMNFGGKVIKGAPYSAQAVTETIQTLSDGNRIVNKSTSAQYRDTEGRTRREQSIKMLGPVVDGGEPLQTVFINDPVAGVSYTLDSRTHTAHKSMPFRFTTKLDRGADWTPGPGGEGQRFEFKIDGPPPTAGVMKVTPAPGVTTVGPVDDGHTFTLHTDVVGGSSYMFRRVGPGDNSVKEEQLGKQSFDGVEADGTRTTITIPAGEIGNERAIEIVSERWYSNDLQMVVMTRHSDPRTGETTYKLTNISRTEPVKSLFEVPSDYTIQEAKPGTKVMQLPARVRKPE